MNNHAAPGTGNYAVITGATGGLGTSFALDCARRGYDLLLLGLPNENLSGLSAFIRKNFDINVLELEADISADGVDQQVLEIIHRNNIAVSMLINNAGIPQNDLFEDTNAQYMRKMIGVNCLGMMSLTKALLPELKKQTRSNIICVSSLGSFYILPRKTCYTATKGFIRQFCQALRMEVAPYGINVSILCPGPMTTNLANYQLHMHLNWFSKKMVLSPAKVADYTLRKTMQGKEIIIPGRLNRVLKAVASLVPEFIQKKLSSYSMKQLGNH